MAQKGIFRLDIVDTDKFLGMPISAQCLYFHLGMKADDNGNVTCPRAIMRAIGCCEMDLEILDEKGFISCSGNGAHIVRQ